MRMSRFLISGTPTLLLVLATASAVPPHQPSDEAGQGLVIELDNKFIQDLANRATITSDLQITKLSAVHPAASDGEVHCGSWAVAAGLPCVAEVMNAAPRQAGAPARLALIKAARNGDRPTVKGAWRLWGEHGGSVPALQALGSDPDPMHPGMDTSNPDHVFEIHPITTVTVGGKVTDATQSIGDTPGVTPHDAQKAFVQGYETLPCKIIAKEGRTRIITHALGFNFTNFMIQLNEDPVLLKDEGGKEDGHGVICSVLDTDGELLVRSRRMVFIPGTAADAEVAELKKGQRMLVTGIPRISLKLVQWRLKNKDDPRFEGNSPLEWRLPYEMIIVAARHVEGAGD